MRINSLSPPHKSFVSLEEPWAKFYEIYKSLTIWQSQTIGIPFCGRSTFEHHGHSTLS